MSIAKKIILIYVALILFTVILTSILSYLIFQRMIDNQISVIDVDTSVIKLKIENLYEKKSNLFELPDLSEEVKKNKKEKNPRMLFDIIEKDFSDYHFKVETMEGIIEYQEKPTLIYDSKEAKYFFEISRQIQFKESDSIRSLKLSLKINFFQIILKSLLLGALITIFILIPLVIFFSRNIIGPVLKVSKGARQIANGNLGVQVKYTANDELGELACSFNIMSKELSKIKKTRDDLLAVVSHELRSPLGRIKGYTELLDDLKLSKKEQKIYYKSIINEIDLLDVMAGEIIEISRLELNKEQLFIERISIADVLKAIESELELDKKMNKKRKYLFKYTENLYCNIDFEKIKRVFINVIENSKKAKAKQITVCAERIGKKVQIKFIDDGVGISEEQLEIVFEKFYRVDKSRDRKTGGFGLGLAICKGIIKEHEGDIFFVKKDKGAELRIELLANDE